MIENIFNFIENINISVILSAIITAAMSARLFKLTPKYNLTRERYDKVIYPLFNALEPYLFGSFNMTALMKATEVFEMNKTLAGGRLSAYIYYCHLEKDDKTFKELCKHIDREYDKHCLRLGIPLRGYFYRIDREQYRSKLMIICYFLLNLAGLLLGPFLFVLTVYVLYRFFNIVLF